MSFIISFVPAVLVVGWIYRNKKAALPYQRSFWWVLLLGVLAVVPVSIIGLGLEAPFAGIKNGAPVLYTLLDNVLLVGIVEEGCKFLAVYWGTGRLKKLRYNIDLLPYGIVAATGFALLENVFYLLDDNSLFLGLIRGLFPAPAHMVYTSIVVLFYLLGQQRKRPGYLFLGLALAGAVHGCNNFCLTWTTDSEINFAYVYLLLLMPLVTALIYMLIISILRRYRAAVIEAKVAAFPGVSGGVQPT